MNVILSSGYAAAWKFDVALIDGQKWSYDYYILYVNLKIYLQIASWTLKFRHEYASDIYKAIRRRTNASL